MSKSQIRFTYTTALVSTSVCEACLIIPLDLCSLTMCNSSSTPVIVTGGIYQLSDMYQSVVISVLFAVGDINL